MKNLKFNDLLREARLNKGYSLAEISERVDIPKTTIHNIESGLIQRPKIKHLERLSHILGLDAEAIIIMSGKIPPDVYKKLIENPDLIFKIKEI